jgi:hypothetical protein
MKMVTYFLSCFCLQPKPKLGDHKLIIVFVIGGISGTEVCSNWLQDLLHEVLAGHVFTGLILVFYGQIESRSIIFRSLSHD